MDLAAINAVSDIVVKENIGSTKYVVFDGSEPEEGYLAVHKIITVLGSKKSLEFFVKLIPLNTRTNVVCQGFYNECLFYETLYPALLRFQQSRGCERFKSVPKCYKAINFAYNEAIVLENLKASGYSTFNRKEPMPKGHLELVLRQFGYFHATCFAFKERNPELYSDIIQRIRHPLEEYKNGSDFKIFFEFLVQAAKQSLYPADERILTVFHEFSRGIMPFLMNMDSLKTHTHSIITHTDGWSNNLMFNYTDQTNPTKPTELRIIDWQMMTVAPPVIDVAYFFYSACSKADMDMLEHYLDVYYSHLSMYMKKLGSSPEILYPHSIFLQQWKVYSRYGLILGLLVIRNMLTEKDEALAMKAMLEEDKNMCTAFMLPIRNEEIYKKRIRDVIIHFVQKGFLD